MHNLCKSQMTMSVKIVMRILIGILYNIAFKLPHEK